MKTVLPTVLLMLTMFAAPVSRAAGDNCAELKEINFGTGDSITVYKQSLSKTHKFSIYSDANQRVIFFSVKGEEGRAYQLFIFDLEGKLVKQTEIRSHQTTVLKVMERGDYLFDVFSDDLKIGNGQLTIR